MTQPIPQKPISPQKDLRDMLRAYLIQRSLACMQAAAERRAAAVRGGDLDAYRAAIHRAVKGFYGRLPVGKNGSHLNARPVTSYPKEGYRIENILFESFPGWEVNATVYVPLDYPPPFPAVIVPVGHSGKQFESYQYPCQFFARAGYLAITFDPPGQSGEKQPGNDHFIDGVRGYPLGETSSQYFIADALRCIDYLETRGDVDSSRGFAMTGVSGGGTTTLLAGLLDDRISVSGPSCCVTPLADLDITQCYAGCPETHMWRRYPEGIDEIDLICAAAPKPVLLMAGEKDEVFRIADTRRLAGEAKRFYERAGAGEHFEFFVDAGGHAYSLTQARQFVAFMDRWLKPGFIRDPAGLPDETFSLIPYPELQCHPRTDVNMNSLAGARVEELRAHRAVTPDTVRLSAARLVGTAGAPAAPAAEAGEPFQVWQHHWQQILLHPEAGIDLPATFLFPVETRSGAVLLHFDDLGRHAAMEQNGVLVQAVRFLEKNGHSLFSVDLRGWGDTAMALYPYELPWWGSRDRFSAYMSAALGDAVMSMRVRDGLAALAYIRSRRECAGKPVVISGHGLGGIVALHVAAIAADVAGVVLWESLLSLEELVAEPQYAWPADAFLPNMLLSYDLPELAASLACPVRIFNPLDARRQPYAEKALAKLRPSFGAHTSLTNAGQVEIGAEIQKLLDTAAKSIAVR
jgi:dienelactone hydrolase